MRTSDVAYESLRPIGGDDEATDHLRLLVDAVLGSADRINEIAGEREVEVEVDGELVSRDMPGWSLPFDLDHAPRELLSWTAQFVGSTITPAMSDEDAKIAIKTPDGFSRGLERAVRAAGERTLRFTRRLVIYPRIPDDLTVYIRTLTHEDPLQSETPDPALTESVLRAQIPWWLRLDYAAVEGLSYVDIPNEWSTYSAIEDDEMTYAGIEVTPP